MKLALSLIVTIWLVTGIVASGQRGYLSNDEAVDCTTLADTALTIVVGPLNYVGVNPKATCLGTPKPSR